MMQMLEDTLIEHAHTKPLLQSQLIRYREVQVPDGMLQPLNILFLRVSNSLGLLGKIFVFASIELLFLSSVVGYNSANANDI